MSSRLRPTLNLCGLVRSSSWSVSTPGIKVPDNPLHCIRILRPVIMVGPGPNLRYSRGAKIFMNDEAMWAKETATTEKNAVSKAR